MGEGWGEGGVEKKINILTILRMKKILIFGIGLFLVGCGSSEEKLQTIELNNTEPVTTVGEGEFCGGTEKLTCGIGLECFIDVESVDVSGKCIDTVEEKYLECPPTQAPVCGLKRNQKNAYLNECEAKRHGAKILHDRFCEVEDIAGDCKAEVLSVGNCEVIHTGYMKKLGGCAEVKVAGCEIETPFENLEACQNSCE